MMRQVAIWAVAQRGLMLPFLRSVRLPGVGATGISRQEKSQGLRTSYVYQEQKAKGALAQNLWLKFLDSSG